MGRKPAGPTHGGWSSGQRRRNQGAWPDFGKWAAQQNKKRRKEGFSIFETKDSNTIQTQV
jgi:hypothetical protein